MLTFVASLFFFDAGLKLSLSVVSGCILQHLCLHAPSELHDSHGSSENTEPKDHLTQITETTMYCKYNICKLQSHWRTVVLLKAQSSTNLFCDIIWTIVLDQVYSQVSGTAPSIHLAWSDKHAQSHLHNTLHNLQ